MLFGGGKNKDGMLWWLFQRFQKSVESGSGKHVNLIHDEYFVFAHLWRNIHLLNELANIVHTVVRGGIEFVDIV